MGAILHPAPVAFEVLARGHLPHRAYDGYEVALARHFDPQHTEASLRALKGHPLDDPGKPFVRVCLKEMLYHA